MKSYDFSRTLIASPPVFLVPLADFVPPFGLGIRPVEEFTSPPSSCSKSDYLRLDGDSRWEVRILALRAWQPPDSSAVRIYKKGNRRGGTVID